MAVLNVKLLCLCLVAVAATVAAHEVQTLPGKGGRLTGGGGGQGPHGVQTLPGKLGGNGGFGGGIPPRTPQVQPRPYRPRPGNNLKPIGRPTGPLTRPFPVPPKGGSLTKPLPRPSKGGDRFRRQNDYDSDESDERRYRRQLDEPEDDEEYDYEVDDEE